MSDVGLVRRTHWHARYLRGVARRRWRQVHLDAPGARRAGRALWICSWQRSGSTWLAEMLAGPPGTRLVYEPANLADGVRDGAGANRVALPREGGDATARVLAALDGSLAGPWVDQLNRCHLARRRVVKDVRAIWLLGEVHQARPGTPMVLLVRHPFDVAASAVALGWAGGEDPSTAFADEVGRWCAAHRAVLADPRLEGVLLVDYESLVADPLGTVRRVLDYAGGFDQTWRTLDVTRVDPTRRSATDFSPAAGTSPWRPEESRRTEVAGTLRECGLGELYGEGPACLTDPGDVARALRAGR